jgi:REP element-mobilizing transposase RayT
MPRALRIEYPGAIYHLMNRGDRREPVFRDDADRRRFLATLAEACTKTDWQIHAFCLMGNHFHLVIETPSANLVAGMRWFLSTYTARFNRRHKLFGHVFSGRYKALIVDGSGNGYLRTVCDYVHLNPARANLLSPEQKLREFRWSSWPIYLGAAEDRPRWLRVDRLLGELGIPQDSDAGREQLEQYLERRRAQEDGEEFKAIRRGWCLGDETFRKELLENASQRATESHHAHTRRETTEDKAQRLLTEELARLGWERTELARRKWDGKTLAARRKGDVGKVTIAERLRRETTMTLAWIAERLQMGTKTHLAHLLYWHGRGGKKA